MPFEMSVGIRGDERLSRIVNTMAENVEDLQPALKNIAEDFRGIMEEQFESQGSRSGDGWKDLAAETVQNKKRKYPAHANDILIASERMVRSLTSEGHSDHVERVEDGKLAVGTSVFYAKFHQQQNFSVGGQNIGILSQSSQGLPQRKIIQLTKQDKQRWLSILQGHVTDRIDFAGVGDITMFDVRPGAFTAATQQIFAGG